MRFIGFRRSGLDSGSWEHYRDFRVRTGLGSKLLMKASILFLHLPIIPGLVVLTISCPIELTCGD